MVPADDFAVGLAPPPSGGSGGWLPVRYGRNVAGVFLLRDLISARTWLAITSLIVGTVTGFVGFMVTVVGTAVGVATLPICLAGAPLLGCVLRFDHWFGAMERGRLTAMTDTPALAGWPAAARPRYRWGIVPHWRTVTNRVAWSELGYALLRFPVSVAGMALAVSSWGAGLALVALPLYNSRLPRGGLVLGDNLVLTGRPTMVGCVVLGVVLLLSAPQIGRGFAAADVSLAGKLLGTRQDAAERIAELEQSRERVVDVAEAERRRIERDLHDGAQQRLVALAMELGRAKTKFGDDLDAARALVDQAHEEAKAALTDLRDLVRGVHPPVLTERGLDAALSGVAARCPVPVEIHVDVPVRPKAAVEAIAYFVVAEALTNVAKHSRATAVRVWVSGSGYPGTLTIMISDDGVGGANPGGAGLTGLADRVKAVDGRFSVESPSGGPTIIAAELPCA
jgi:signal transduction histidine kinase